ncbi:MAG: family 20 glycosylhydrolase [Muribaculaceae bacterium]|nr:family 20 glycosylhydrolase [Muribaculaceae bacterium]
MRKSFSFLIPGVLMALCACSPGTEQTAVYSVIPLPASIEQNNEAPGFHLTSHTQISYPKGNESLEKNAKFLKDYIKQLTDLDLKITDEAREKDVIILSDNLGGENPEGYQLTVNEKAITINGNSAAGNFYGIQTLRKSIPVAEKSNVTFPAVTISDMPRFGYRGAMFDVSRHFFPVDSVKSFIDMLALHNINRMHWHLTDDQGWRVEIKSRPLLTELGSKRGGTVIGHNSGVYDSIPVEGFFTQEEIKDIINYAADRYITIIPEIDMPGHMLGALKGYPELGCTGGPYEVWQMWGVSEDVLCAGNDSTYAFIEDVLGEIADLFPSEYIHVGGDECPKVRWAECVVCQAKIKELGLKADEHGTKEEKLQSHFIHHAADFLASKGKKMIGWDETLEGGAAPGAVIMSWRGEAGGIQAAKQGHDVIMTPNNYMYFDYYQTLDREGEPDAIGGYVPIEKVYGYEPYPAELTPEEAAHIIGVQANLWTEYIPTLSQAQYQELPRMSALSEVQWSSAPKDFKGFIHRVPQMLNQYDANGYNYCKHIFNVAAEITPNQEEGVVAVELSTLDDAPIYYTLDGTEPTASSTLYESPLKLNETAKIKAVSIRDNKPGRIFKDSVKFSKATLKPVSLETPPAKRYEGKGPLTLVDGMNGVSNGFNNGGWLGFYGKEMVAVIDLEETQPVSEVSTNTSVDTGSWVFDARSMKVSVSEDGKTWKEVAFEQYPAMTEAKNGVFNHALSFAPVDTRYVKLTLGLENSIPEWHNGKGNPGFLFVDEIYVN